MTPTTAAVMAVSGALNLRLLRVASTSGPPTKMNRNDGRNVKKVATHAPATPAAKTLPTPKISFVTPPKKPTKATIIISGPGVVSPSARPSIMALALSH